ncbi:MAG: hypothetical protein HY532_05030 [Chloroflexi bacterium]|nr:hypothetical protein [Chloroflexota bacterium]
MLPKDMPRESVAFYHYCLEWNSANVRGFDAELRYFQSLNPTKITRDLFFRGYCHGNLTSHFKDSIVQSLYHQGLSRALKDYDIEAICKSPDKVRSDALRFIKHPRKIEGIIRVAYWLCVTKHWDELKLQMLTGNVDYLQEAKNQDGTKTFPFMGHTTKYLPARNVGLDCAKPDVHMKRAAGHCGHSPTKNGVITFVEAIRGGTEERLGVIDYVIWEYMRHRPLKRTDDTKRVVSRSWRPNPLLRRRRLLK